MANLEQSLTGATEAPSTGKLNKQEQIDSDIVTGLGSKMIASEQGMEALIKGMGSADPIMAAGQFLAMSILNLNDKLMESGMNIAPRAWMAKNGYADRIAEDITLIAGQAGIEMPAKARQSIVMEAAEMLKGIKSGEEQQAQAGQMGGGQQPQPQPQQGAPAGPSQGGLEQQLVGGM